MPTFGSSESACVPCASCGRLETTGPGSRGTSWWPSNSRQVGRLLGRGRLVKKKQTEGKGGGGGGFVCVCVCVWGGGAFSMNPGWAIPTHTLQVLTIRPGPGQAVEY